MLVLKRKPNESVRIISPDGRILAVVTVIGVDGKDAVRLGFIASREVAILRTELTERLAHDGGAGEGRPA
jgi:carbon storage regulator CsrA